MPDAPRLPPSDPTPATTRPATGRLRPTTTARGYGWLHQKKRRVVLAGEPVCQRCFDRLAEHLHHIDGDTSNRAAVNLLALCGPCHRAEHRG